MANCKGCGAPLDISSPNCPFCGVRNGLDLDAISSSTTEVPQEDRTCPNCKTRLTTINVGEGDPFYIESCDSCGGLFFDNGELQAILKKRADGVTRINHNGLQRLLREPLESNHSVKYRPCPVCSEIMNREKFGEKSGVIIDHCHAHGIWLEPGELTRLSEWKKEGGEILDAQRKYQEEERKLKQERERIRSTKSADSYSMGGELFTGSSYGSAPRHSSFQKSSGNGIDLFDVISEIASWFFKR